MKHVAVGMLAVALTAVCAVPAQVAEPPKRDPLMEQVRRAIDRGVEYLRHVEDGPDRLEPKVLSRFIPGGGTSLAMLALLNAGVRADDPLIQHWLKYQRGLKPEKTYQVGLQTAVFALAGQIEDQKRIQDNVDWLIAAAVRDRDGKLLGWGYSKGLGPADNSNGQYALLGLHEGFLAGARIKPGVWEEIRDCYAAGQKGGGWTYRRLPDYDMEDRDDEAKKGIDNTLTMTTAGLCGLLIATRDLEATLQNRPRDWTTRNHGPQQNEHIEEALAWLDKQMPRDVKAVGLMQHRCYALYGIERAGRLSGRRFLGGVDWYRLGCEYLVKAQKDDGSWSGEGHEVLPQVATSFALLFLSRGRTPVLVGD
jgi:hypothetical protein